VDLIISPTTVAFNTQSGAPTPAFQAGEVLDALVLQLLDNGVARLSIANTLLDVQTQVPLIPGTTVRLAVKSTTDGVKLVILDNGAANAGVAAPSGRPAVSTPGAINSATTGGAGLIDTPTAPAQPTDPVAQNLPSAPASALSQAVRTAAMQQNGLAPLFADIAEATSSPSVTALPQPVRAAAEQLLALRPALNGNLSGGDLEQAFVQSGLFLEARVAANVGASGAQPGSNADAPATTGSPSGANAGASPTAMQMPVPAEDLKAALIVLRQVLATWLDASQPQAGFTTPNAPRPLLPPVPQAPSLVPDGPEAKAPQSFAPMPPAPPPPYRGAPTTAQPNAAPSIPLGADPHDIGARLLAETDGALSRQTLLQAASLPDAGNAQAAQAMRGDNSPRWTFEVPFATPQGNTAIAQFEISRDGRSAPAEGLKAVWRARFSINVEPMGAVHAQVSLIGARAAVTLWAERGEAAAKLRENSSLLSDALKGAELEPGDVLVRDGSPPRPRQATPAGRFLDRAS
jgi:Flagellar hook-length control protein FliK